MKLGVVVFPGSNCDHDAYWALRHNVGVDAQFLFHKDHDLKGSDAIILPGGFSYGDYLRSGAIARFSPIMREVVAFAEKGGPVLGICNGFQILCESGLLPGAMLRNKSVKFLSQPVTVRVERTDTVATSGLKIGDVLKMPIAHGEGNFYMPEDELDRLEGGNQVVFRYADAGGRLEPAANVNGSARAIAGVCNPGRNVVGLMPHPERATEALLGSEDGAVLLGSLVKAAS